MIHSIILSCLLQPYRMLVLEIRVLNRFLIFVQFLAVFSCDNTIQGVIGGKAGSNSEVKVTMSASSTGISLSEGDTFAVAISFSAPLAEGATLNWDLLGGGSDFTANSGFIAVNAGSSFVQFQIEAVADSLVEGFENFQLIVVGSEPISNSLMLDITLLDVAILPPLNPTSLLATPDSSSAITLSWSSGGGSTVDYRLSYQLGAVAPSTCALGTAISESSIAGTSFQVTGLLPSTQYSFRVCAINGASTPDVSSGVAVSASTNSPSISNFTVTGVRAATGDVTADIWLTTNADPQVNWVDATGETSYDVTIYESDGVTPKCLTANVAADTTTHTFSSCALSNGSTYQMKVEAKNSLDTVSATNSPFVFVAYFQNTESGLVAAYGFEENSGSTTVDMSSYSNTATRSGATWTASGKFGNALNFDGTSQYVSAPDASHLDIPQAITLMAWVYPIAIGGGIYRAVIDKETHPTSGYQLAANVDAPVANVPGFYLADGSSDGASLTGISTLNINQWHHLAGVYDGATSSFYLDGILISQQGFSVTQSDNSAILRIGSSPAGEFFAGRIDEVRIYNRALSYEELTLKMNTPLIPTGAGPFPFSISGVTGGLDGRADNTLTDGVHATIHWDLALGASSYQVAIYENDGVSVKCSIVLTTSNSHDFSTCDLTMATTYKAQVVALGSDGSTTTALNSQYSFTVDATQILPVYPIYGANWNDYISFDGTTDRLHQVESPCINSGGNYFSCIHGGQLRQFATSLTSCAGLSASDLLGVFRWVCRLESGNAVFYSTGFNENKGLRDLVQVSAWRQNQVTVSNGSTVAQSSLATWWSNPVTPLPDNHLATDAVQSLSASGTVYTLDVSRNSSGYNIDGDQISLVTLPGVVLRYSGNSAFSCAAATGETASPDRRCLISAGSQNRLWIEGTFNGFAGGASDSQVVINLNTIGQSVIRNTQLGRAQLEGVDARALRASLVQKVKSVDNGNSGFLLTDQSGNPSLGLVLDGILASNNGGPGIFLGNGPVTDSYFSGLVLGGNSYNFQVDGWSPYVERLTISHVTSINAAGGLVFGDFFRNLTIAQILSVNNDAGMDFSDAHNSGSQAANLVVTDNQWGIYFYNNNSSDQTIFSGNLLLGNNSTTNCFWDVTTAAGLADSTCVNQGSSSAVLRTGVTNDTSFVGNVTSDDLSNADDVNGIQSFVSITDWFFFDHFFRTWGWDASPFPLGLPQSKCQNGSCRIWDLRLSSSGTAVRNLSGNGLTPNEAFVSGSPCPSAVQGNVVLTDSSVPANTFLINATEIIGDEIGDENGLCESNEACIYSPNFGAYQGEGDYLAGGACQFQEGSVSGVTMYAYPINGL